MKISRPFTASRDNLTQRKNLKATFSHKRPLSANNQSLKKIIQVIEKTLNRGAQSNISKSKCVEKVARAKHQSADFTQLRLSRERPRREREIPQYKTQFTIGNSLEIHKSARSFKSIKKIHPSQDQDEFIPYKMQQGNFLTELQPSFQRERAPLKKLTRKAKTIKSTYKQNVEPQIDKWQNDASLLHMSFLLD